MDLRKRWLSTPSVLCLIRCVDVEKCGELAVVMVYAHFEPTTVIAVTHKNYTMCSTPHTPSR